MEQKDKIRDSIVASIPACHAGDRGSIPRHGDPFTIKPSNRSESPFKPCDSCDAISCHCLFRRPRGKIWCPTHNRLDAWNNTGVHLEGLEGNE